MYSLKPNEFDYEIEIPPLDILNKMKLNNLNSSSLLKSALNDHDWEFFKKQRVTIIKTLRKFIKEFKFRAQTFYLAIYYFDRICVLNEFVVNNLNIELIGIGCLLLASIFIFYKGKFLENDPNIPELIHYRNLSNKSLSLEDLKKYEFICLEYLSYKLDVYTIYHFLKLLIIHGIAFSDDFIDKQKEKENNNMLSKTVSKTNCYVSLISTNYEHCAFIYKLNEKAYDILERIVDSKNL